MTTSEARLHGFFDEMEKIGGWRNTLGDAAAMLSIPLTGALMGAGVGAAVGSKGNRAKAARKGAVIGGGIGAGVLGAHLVTSAGERALKRALSEDAQGIIGLTGMTAGGFGAHALDKKMKERE